MKKAFSMIEMVFVIVMLGILAAVSVMYIPNTYLQQAADSLINNLKYAKTLAQSDDRYYTMGDNSLPDSVSKETQMRYWKAGMWQVQFHLSGNIADSYSIYADTGRNATTTNFDGRPMAGDLIAKDPINKACLSGYSQNNLPSECNNNIAREVRLTESYGVNVKEVDLQDNCKENNTFRVYFDSNGMPYCGAVNINNNKMPERLTIPIKIELSDKKKTATICISKNGLIYGSNNGQCDK